MRTSRSGLLLVLLLVLLGIGAPGGPGVGRTGAAGASAHQLHDLRDLDRRLDLSATPGQALSTALPETAWAVGQQPAQDYDQRGRSCIDDPGRTRPDNSPLTTRQSRAPPLA